MNRGAKENERARDWNCLACGDYQFARNRQCRKCGAKRPLEGETQLVRNSGPLGKGNEPPVGVPNDHERTRDWNCHICGDYQFARNRQCRKCGANRLVGEAVVTSGGPPSHKGKGNESTAQLPVKEWTCFFCGDFQFARNRQCRKCGTKRPTTQEVKEREERAKEEALLQEQAQQERLATWKVKYDEMVRRYTRAGWEQLRLLFIGHFEDGCILSCLPRELVVHIAIFCCTVDTDSSLLKYFKMGRKKLAMETFDSDPSGLNRSYFMSGRTLEYHPERPPGAQYELIEWADHSGKVTNKIVGTWSEAQMLARMSFDPSWERQAKQIIENRQSSM